MTKLRNVLLMGSLFTFIGTPAFAEFSMDELLAVTKVALTDFTAAHPDHVDHFTGYKAWKSGEDAKVKVYVTHSGMSMDFNFVCHKHDEAMECHAQ
jgi:hypothetical protein